MPGTATQISSFIKSSVPNFKTSECVILCMQFFNFYHLFNWAVYVIFQVMVIFRYFGKFSFFCFICKFAYGLIPVTNCAVWITRYNNLVDIHIFTWRVTDQASNLSKPIRLSCLPSGFRLKLDLPFSNGIPIFTDIASSLYCRIWSWSPMQCEKHGPRDSVDKSEAEGWGFCRYRGPRAMFFTLHGRPWSNPIIARSLIDFLSVLFT